MGVWVIGVVCGVGVPRMGGEVVGFFLVLVSVWVGGM
jgi:hypothetical protein